MGRFGMRTAVMALAAVSMVGVARAQDTRADEKKFVEQSGLDSLAEINYAKLALQKSQDKNVRDFAQKMITDHEKLIAEMKPFVQKYGIKPSGSPKLADDAKYLELKTKSGTSFDRAYVEAMVKDHHDDLQKFLDEESKTSDPSLKAAVAKGAKVIREHAEMIDGIAHQGGIETPALPSGQ